MHAWNIPTPTFPFKIFFRAIAYNYSRIKHRTSAHDGLNNAVWCKKAHFGVSLMCEGNDKIPPKGLFSAQTKFWITFEWKDGNRPLMKNCNRGIERWRHFRSLPRSQVTETTSGRCLQYQNSISNSQTITDGSWTGFVRRTLIANPDRPVEW